MKPYKISYRADLRASWKSHLYQHGIDVKMSKGLYTSYMYPKGVPKSRIRELLNTFYKQQYVFVPKEKRSKFTEKFKETFKDVLKQSMVQGIPKTSYHPRRGRP